MDFEASEDLLLRLFACMELNLAERLRLALTCKRWRRLLMSDVRLSRLDVWHASTLLPRGTDAAASQVRCIDVSSLQELERGAWEFHVKALLSIFGDGPGAALLELKLWSPDTLPASGRDLHWLSAAQLQSLLASCPRLRGDTRLAVSATSAAEAAALLTGVLPEGRHSVLLQLRDCKSPPLDAAAVESDCASLRVALRCPRLASLSISHLPRGYVASETQAEREHWAAWEKLIEVWFQCLLTQLMSMTSSCVFSHLAHLEYIFVDSSRRYGYDLEVDKREGALLAAGVLNDGPSNGPSVEVAAAGSAALAHPPSYRGCTQLQGLCLQGEGILGGSLVASLFSFAAAAGDLRHLVLGKTAAYLICDDDETVARKAMSQLVALEVVSLRCWDEITAAPEFFCDALAVILASPSRRLRTLEISNTAFENQCEDSFLNFCDGITGCSSLRTLSFFEVSFASWQGRAMRTAISGRSAPLHELVLTTDCDGDPADLVEHMDWIEFDVRKGEWSNWALVLCERARRIRQAGGRPCWLLVC